MPRHGRHPGLVGDLCVDGGPGQVLTSPLHVGLLEVEDAAVEHDQRPIPRRGPLDEGNCDVEGVHRGPGVAGAEHHERALAGRLGEQVDGRDLVGDRVGPVEQGQRPRHVAGDVELGRGLADAGAGHDVAGGEGVAEALRLTAYHPELAHRGRRLAGEEDRDSPVDLAAEHGGVEPGPGHGTGRGPGVSLRPGRHAGNLQLEQGGDHQALVVVHRVEDQLHESFRRASTTNRPLSSVDDLASDPCIRTATRRTPAGRPSRRAAPDPVPRRTP